VTDFYPAPRYFSLYEVILRIMESLK